MEYIYLLKVRTLSENDLFKIGRTSQKPFQRINSYENDTDVIIILKVGNSVEFEREAITNFKKRFMHDKKVGNEYFRGNVDEMTNVILCMFQMNNYNPSTEKNNSFENKVFSFLKHEEFKFGYELYMSYNKFIKKFDSFLLENNYDMMKYTKKELIRVLSTKDIVYTNENMKDHNLPTRVMKGSKLKGICINT
jgi:hypothetical protein